MANYHLSASTGKHARAKQQYNEREGTYANQDDKCVFSLSENLPAFAHGSSELFWKNCDTNERANANKYREFEVSLPVELTREKQKQLAVEFARIIAKGYGTDAGKLPFTLAIHEGKGHNPHAHILFCERGNNSEMSAKNFFSRKNPKNVALGGSQRKNNLKFIRETWAEIQNKHLAQNGSRERVSHLSHEAQGIDKKPQLHVGTSDVNGVRSARNDAIKTENYVTEYQCSQRKPVRDLQTVANELRPKHKPVKPNALPTAQRTAIKRVFVDIEDYAYKNMRNELRRLQELQNDFQPGLFTLIINLFGVQTRQQKLIAQVQKRMELAKITHLEAKQQKQLIASVIDKTPMSELARELKKVTSPNQFKKIGSAAAGAKSQNKELTKDFQREVEYYRRDEAIAKVAQQRADDVQRLLKRHEREIESQSEQLSRESHEMAM